MTEKERFLQWIEKSGDCWLWRSSTRKSNNLIYGYCVRQGKRVRAHRLAWTLWRGPIPPGMYVLHRCDVPLCVRPSHLFLGTAVDNTMDMLSKGRGMDCHRLDPAKVRKIRRLRAEGLQYREIADRFGVSVPMIHYVCSRKSWAHVE